MYVFIDDIKKRESDVSEGEAVRMGIYLNSRSPYLLFRREYESVYFVDKTDILEELVHLVERENHMPEDSGLDQGKGQKYV